MSRSKSESSGHLRALIVCCQPFYRKRERSSRRRRLEQENIDLNIKVQELQQENVDKENELQRLREEGNEMSNEVQELREEIVNKSNQIHQLEEDKNVTSNEMQELREEIVNKSSQIHQLEEDKNGMSNEMQELREEIVNKSSEVHQLLEDKNELNNEICRLREAAKSRYRIEEQSVVFSTNDMLGRGAYGAVYEGVFYGSKVAVKEYHEIIISDYNKQILQREVYIASQCRHPNLLQFICATRNDQSRLLIVTELMDMTLRSLTEQHARFRSRLEYEELRLISLDVACGLNYLHSMRPKPIVHRDISSANVLLQIWNHSTKRAKISDYGSANFMDMCKTSNPGAALYAAPEAGQTTQDPKVIEIALNYSGINSLSCCCTRQI